MLRDEYKSPEMKRHHDNLKRSLGKNGIEYKYILTQDDLTRAWMESRKDLAYALRKEVKRDRYVLNTEGLQKDLEKALVKAIDEAYEQLRELVEKGLIPDIERTLNMITVKDNQFVAPKLAKSKSSWASRFGAMLGRAIAKTTVKMFEETTGLKNRRNRK